jgi:hypothetical protein
MADRDARPDHAHAAAFENLIEENLIEENLIEDDEAGRHAL